MIRVREGDVESLISIDEFEARARNGEMSPFAWVCIPTLTGDSFVQARELPLFVALYDPRRLHFRRHFALARLPLVTGVVVALCVALFLLSRHLGDGVVTREVLLDLGAKARARILEDGEAWRLLAANLLHRDVVHLGFNLFALLNIGTVLEGVYRRGDYVLVLVVSGLCTMATSAVMSGPVTVGASGLVFGCLGCAVVFGWRYGDVLPLRYRTYFGVVVVVYAAVMFYLGLRSPSTDNWGHAGGLVAGLALGSVLTPRLLRLTDAPREPLRQLVRPFAIAAAICAALLVVGPLLPHLFVRMKPYPVETFGVVLERPAHWSKASDPLGFLTFGNGVDAFASLGCADRRGPSRLDEAAERFVGTELKGLARGGHIGNLKVSEPVPSAVGTGEHTSAAVRVHFSFMASDGPLDADALLFSRGQLECALVLAARPSASPSSAVRLDEFRTRLRFVTTRAEVLAKRNVTGRPSSPSAWLDLALAHQRGGAVVEARAAFMTAERLTADVGGPEASAALGHPVGPRALRAVGFAGDAKAAVGHAERAVTLTGGDRDATLVLLEALLEGGEVSRARAHMDAARERLGVDGDLDALEKRLVAEERAREATASFPVSAFSLARAALVLLLVIAAGAWMLALFTSSQPPGPALLVYGERVALSGAVWPARVVAAWPAQKRRASFTGVVVTASGRVPIEDSVARVPLPANPGELTVVIEGESEGAPASVSVTLTLVDELPVLPLPLAQPWTAELAAGTQRDRAGPPLYPVAGRQPAMLPSELVVVTDEALEIVSVVPNVAGTTAPDGRALRLDPSGVVLEVPLAASAGEVVHVSARSVGPTGLHLNLIVNGVVRDMAFASLPRGQTSVPMRIPSDAGEGWFAVHGAASPLAGVRGVTAVGLLVDDAAALSGADLVAQLSSHPSLRSADDPLLARMQRSPPASLTPVRALLGRLRIDDVRPANLAPTAAAQAALDDAKRRSLTARYRAPFRVAGGLFALLATALALISAAQNARWRAESGESGRRQLAPAGWSLLALLASLSALWILDWAIGLMQNRPSG